MAENSAENSSELTVYSQEQHSHLQALGYVLYQPITKTAISSESTHTTPADFWQTALGQKIAGYANNADISQLQVSGSTRTAAFKRAVWLQLKALR